MNNPEAIKSFRSELVNSLDNMILPNNILLDPNIAYNALANIIQSAKQKHLPIKTVKFNKYRHKLSLWMTDGIMKSIKFRDSLYKKLKSTLQTSPNYVLIENSLISFNKILQKDIRLAKAQFFSSQFERYKCDARKTWTKINEIISKRKKKHLIFRNIFWTMIKL